MLAAVNRGFCGGDLYRQLHRTLAKQAGLKG
jgi:hypothetical protein